MFLFTGLRGYLRGNWGWGFYLYILSVSFVQVCCVCVGEQSPLCFLVVWCMFPIGMFCWFFSSVFMFAVVGSTLSALILPLFPRSREHCGFASSVFWCASALFQSGLCYAYDCDVIDCGASAQWWFSTLFARKCKGLPFTGIWIVTFLQCSYPQCLGIQFNFCPRCLCF